MALAMAVTAIIDGKAWKPELAPPPEVAAAAAEEEEVTVKGGGSPQGGRRWPKKTIKIHTIADAAKISVKWVKPGSKPFKSKPNKAASGAPKPGRKPVCN